MSNQSTSNDLREMAKRYRDAADRLESAAEALDGLGSNGRALPSTPTAKAKDGQTLRSRAMDRRRKRTGRLKQLSDFLREYGPTDRRTMASKTEIPLATVAYLLKPDNGFRQVEYGVWDVVRKEDSDVSRSE